MIGYKLITRHFLLAEKVSWWLLALALFWPTTNHPALRVYRGLHIVTLLDTTTLIAARCLALLETLLLFSNTRPACLPAIVTVGIYY